MGYIYGLYCTCHPEDGIRYVGQTVREPKKRLDQHIRNSKYEKGHSIVYRWIAKHSAKNICMEILEECNEEEIDFKEIFWIFELSTTTEFNGMNLTSGGKSGYEISNVTKERISIGHSGVPRGPMDEKVKTKISKSKRGQFRGKLQPKDIPDIRERIESGEYMSEIAALYGVRRAAISDIGMGKTWARVDNDGVYHSDWPLRREVISGERNTHRKRVKNEQ